MGTQKSEVGRYLNAQAGSLHSDEMMMPAGRRHNTGNLTQRVTLNINHWVSLCTIHFSSLPSLVLVLVMLVIPLNLN